MSINLMLEEIAKGGDSIELVVSREVEEISNGSTRVKGDSAKHVVSKE